MFCIVRHLAAEFGTKLAASPYMSSLLWVDDSQLGEALLFLVFSVMCCFHQMVMISVIKVHRIVGLADLHGVNI
jgi:hypothetical protein